MTRDINIEFRAAYTRKNIRLITSEIQYELEDFIESYEIKRIVIPLSNTIETISLVATLKPFISRGMIDLIFLSNTRSKRIIPKNLESFLKLVGATPVILSFDEDLLKILKTYLPKTPKESILQSLNALLIRKYADSREAIVVRPFTYTHWILGAFDDIEFKTSDYLPFIRIYYSNMKKISHLFRLDRYFSKAKIDPRISRILDDLNIPSINKLDMILDKLMSEMMVPSNDEEYKEVDIPPESIKKLANIIKKKSLKRITPTPIP